DALKLAGYRRIGFAGWTEEGSEDPYSEVRCRAYIGWAREQGMFDPAICATGRPVERNTEQTGYNVARPQHPRRRRDRQFQRHLGRTVSQSAADDDPSAG